MVLECKYGGGRHSRGVDWDRELWGCSGVLTSPTTNRKQRENWAWGYRFGTSHRADWVT